MGYMTDWVVLDFDGLDMGAGAEKAGPVVAVGSREGSSGLTGLVRRGTGPRKLKFDGD